MYKVMIPAVETRVVTVNYVFNVDTKEEADSIIEAAKNNEDLSKIESGIIEDIEVINTPNVEYVIDDIDILEFEDSDES